MELGLPQGGEARSPVRSRGAGLLRQVGRGVGNSAERPEKQVPSAVLTVTEGRSAAP